MKNRFYAVDMFYYPYVQKHLGDKSLQNIVTTGGSFGAIHCEIKRHDELTYENIFHYELMDNQILDFEDQRQFGGKIGGNVKSKSGQIIKDNILCPDDPIQSVNLIYADVGGNGELYDIMMEGGIENGVNKILEAGFVNNKLGILVFLYFDGIGIEPFLDKQYGSYKSKDFFSSNIVWDDGQPNCSGTQRLDGVVFYE